MDGFAATSRESEACAMTGVLPESVATTVNAACVAAVGWPEISPVPLRVKPSGRTPDARDQTYGGVPPVAVREAEYAAPLAAGGSCVVVICTGAACGVAGGWLGVGDCFARFDWTVPEHPNEAREAAIEHTTLRLRILILPSPQNKRPCLLCGGGVVWEVEDESEKRSDLSRVHPRA